MRAGNVVMIGRNGTASDRPSLPPPKENESHRAAQEHQHREQHMRWAVEYSQLLVTCWKRDCEASVVRSQCAGSGSEPPVYVVVLIDHQRRRRCRGYIIGQTVRCPLGLIDGTGAHQVILAMVFRLVVCRYAVIRYEVAKGFAIHRTHVCLSDIGHEDWRVDPELTEG